MPALDHLDDAREVDVGVAALAVAPIERFGLCAERRRGADRVRRLRNHGRDDTGWQRHESTQAGRERYVETGYNYRLTDIAAAIGLEQMKRLDQIVSDRRRVAKRYDQAFRQQERLSVAYNNYGAQTNAQTYMLRLIGATPQHRDTLVTQLREKGIGAKAGLACIHQEPCYADAYPGVLLPNSEQLSEQMLLLPLFPQLTEEQQDRVIESVCTIVDTMRVTPKPERRWSLV
ncbi:MAG: DegT/DnrJ/EryC1/StrS aminotransferase family protein [Planctomycetes bacterium]|nr:DegT/DnrJ/EryC1/StrS aminotransferase family protein [Planctomycetota bacterium]